MNLKTQKGRLKKELKNYDNKENKENKEKID
jgi:hypothetical protein